MAKRLSKKDFAKKKQAELKDTISNAMDEVRSYKNNPEEMKEYLDFVTAMYSYSPRNQMLLNSQYQGSVLTRSGFTGVASKSDFEEKGFRINDEHKEKPLKIIAPVFKNFVKKDDGKSIPFNKLSKEDKERANAGELKKDRRLHYYQLVDVYDIRQTDAKPEDYPKLFPNRPYQFDERNIEDKYPNLKEAIRNYADTKGINVRELENSNHMGAAKGGYAPVSNEIYMKPNLTYGDYIQTLNHELAHGNLHRNSNLSTSTKELEAEMTAYVTNKHFGLDTSEESIKYMSNWTNNLNKLNDKEIIQVVERVSSTSRSMIEGIENEYADVREKNSEKKDDITVDTITFDDVKMDYKDLKGHKVKDVGMLQESDSFSIQKSDGVQIDVYHNSDSKAVFHQHERVDDLSKSTITVEDYVNHAVEKDQGINSKEYAVNEKLSQSNKKHKQQDLEI